jgi:hypothetical protein
MKRPFVRCNERGNTNSKSERKRKRKRKRVLLLRVLRLEEYYNINKMPFTNRKQLT